MIRISIIGFLISIFSLSIDAQDEQILTGLVVDSETQAPIEGVNIFNQKENSGTFTREDGRFKIRIKEFPAQLILSFIGYENQVIKINNLPHKSLIVELKTSILRLPEIEVLAKPKVKKLTKKVFTIKDFIIEDDMILLLKYGGLAVGNYLELTDLEGKRLDEQRIKANGLVERLVQSCLGNIHLLGNREGVEISIQSKKIELIAKYQINKYYDLLEPCVASSQNFVYFKKKQALDQVIFYDFISKKNAEIVSTVQVINRQNIALMYEELSQYQNSSQHYSAATEVPGNISGLKRPEELDAWIGMFYKPVYSPLINIGNEICLFNHTFGFLQFFSFDGKLLRQVPISYYKEKKWYRRILKDKKTNRFYCIYNSKAGKKFYEINLHDGTVSPAFLVESTFSDKMVVYDGFLYFTDSGITNGEQNRVLKKVKVNSSF